MGGREGDGEKSTSPVAKHRIVPTPLLTKLFSPYACLCENRYRIIFNTRGALQERIQAKGAKIIMVEYDSR